MYIVSEQNYHFIHVLCFTKNFRKILYGMTIHFRFFLSHDKSPKYPYFMNKVCILRKFRTKTALKYHGLH